MAGWGITLALPVALLALILPLFAVRLLREQAQDTPMHLPDGIAAHARPEGVKGAGSKRIFDILAWGCLCLALADPQRIVSVPDISASGRDIILAIDMSGSMETRDFALDGQTITRLEAVKRVAQDFILGRKGDRIGLVLFADQAYLASPLSHDVKAVARSLTEANIGLAGRATNLAEGLGLALRRSLASDARAKAIILLSDGRDTAAKLDLREVASLARGKDIRIHTVALGPEDLETRPGARDAVDIAVLRLIAEGANGQVFRVKSLEDLKEMAAELDRLEPNPSERPNLLENHSLWPWPAGMAMVLLICGMVANLARGRIRKGDFE